MPTKTRLFLIGLLLLLILAIAGSVMSQNGYDLSWATAAGGGGFSAGGPYRVTGSIGQPDAGVMSGGPYAIEGGFAAVPGTVSYQMYIPIAGG